MLKEPVVALMGAGFLKQGFVNVMAIRAFHDSTTRGLDSRLASLHERLLHDTAKQQLKELERHFQKRILDKVAVYASLPNPLEFAEPLAGYDMNRFRVGDYRVAFQIDQNIISLADIRQTTNSVNPLCAVSDSSLATATGGLGVVEICVPVARLGQPWLARRG